MINVIIYLYQHNDSSIC